MPSGGRRKIEVERRGNLFANGTLRGGHIETHAAAEEPVCREIAEDEVGIGHRGLLAAVSVTRRARGCARTLRADVQAARVVDRRDAAAARTDFLDVEHRNADRQSFVVAADEVVAGKFGDAPLENATLWQSFRPYRSR